MVTAGEIGRSGWYACQACASVSLASGNGGQSTAAGIRSAATQPLRRPAATTATHIAFQTVLAVPGRGSVALLAELPGTQIILGPGEAGVADARGIHVCRGEKQGVQYSTLCRCRSDRTERQTERVGHKNRARWFNNRGDLDHLGERDCAQPGFVKYPLDQPHGLLADRSSGGEQHQVSVI